MESKIADEAIKARAHLVEALKGLNEIIRLASEAGREDVKEAAEAARQPVKKAAQAFNKEIKDSGGDASKIDPIVVDNADEAADKAQAELKKLYAELEKRVKATEEVAKATDQNLKEWGFGPDRTDAGKPKPEPGSWAGFITDQTLSHAETLYGEDSKPGLVEDVNRASGLLDEHHQALNGRLGEPGLTGRVQALENTVEELNRKGGSSFPFNGRTAGAGGTAALLIFFTVFSLLSMNFSTALIASAFVALVVAIFLGLFFGSKDKTSKQRNPFGSKDKTSSWKNIFRPNNK